MAIDEELSVARTVAESSFRDRALFRPSVGPRMGVLGNDCHKSNLDWSSSYKFP